MKTRASLLEILMDKSKREVHVHFTVSTSQISTTKRHKASVRDRNMMHGHREQPFRRDLEINQFTTHFPATLVKMREKLSSHFRVKSRENKSARDDEQWIVRLARNTGRFSSVHRMNMPLFLRKKRIINDNIFLRIWKVTSSIANNV